MAVGKSYKRVDAYEKVTGRAKYTDDLAPADALVTRVVRSDFANGLVTGFDLREAEKIPGVVKIVTCFDVPTCVFPTAGHPWSVEPGHQDVADRKLLNRRVRVYGDDIAAVVAEDEIAAERAVRAIRVQHETYPVLLATEDALASQQLPLHEEYPGNLLARSAERVGEEDFDTLAAGENVRRFTAHFSTQMVQHSHIESAVCFAYMEKGRIVVVCSTQIPHIVRRVIGQALGIPWGKIRVIKPYIGGGFGNKQEVLYEPLCAFLTTQVGGRAVRLELSREEVFSNTRVRHPFEIDFDTLVQPDGQLVARRSRLVSNQGGYASHGHAIVANGAGELVNIYPRAALTEVESLTVYSNGSTGGAMRGYGVPQVAFGIESHLDDIAGSLGLDPLEIRRMNCMQAGYVDPGVGTVCHTSGLLECMEKGAQAIGWAQKRRDWAKQSGPVRRGVGMGIFCYKAGVWPISVETASCRIVLNQDGSVQLQVGATEIGQGADTVFTQMAAETIGIDMADVHIVSTQDTDTTPFDTGAYASRQTYVTGKAVRQTAEALRARILEYAAGMLSTDAGKLSLQNGEILDAGGQPLLPLADVAMEAFYSLKESQHITAETTFHCTDNTFSFGATFCAVEVDIPLGRVRVLDIINVHDSGRIINPQLAEAQVHGGMSMSLGYALGEQLLLDSEGRMLNGNFLDYKLATALDTPELRVDFVETDDPTGPYGNKSLGEPPAISAAPAIRNAILHATGVGLTRLPMNPQNVLAAFTEAGLVAAVRPAGA